MANYSAVQWARAYTELIQESSSEKQKKKITQRFLEQIQNLAPRERKDTILEVQRQYVKAEGGRDIIIESARLLSKKMLQHLEKAFTEKDVFTFRENPELMAGVRITVNGEQELDMSLKRKLNKLFS